MLRARRRLDRVDRALLGCLAACLIAPGGSPIAAPIPAASDAASGAPARGGAVASSHALATAAGLGALRDGGNAVDAAVATALALAVVYPEAGNLGGGGFALVRTSGPGGGVRALDFRETAPAAARRDMFLDERGLPLAGASTVGPLAAGVPGSPSGLYELHRACGKLPWRAVVVPALRLARDGFAVDAHLHELLSQETHRRLIQRFAAGARVWLPGGAAPPVGAHLRLPELAATLEAYAERGPAAIAEGAVAAAVAAASRAHGGVLDAADLAAYRPVWRQPVTFTAFGWQLASMPLPSAGGIVLGQMAAMLERLGWASLPRGGADRAHLLVEAFRRAFADRVLLGDPGSSRATPAELLDPGWIAARAASIDRGHATPSATLAAWTPEAATAAARRHETTHLSAVDGSGNAVALTTTLNNLFGCGLFVPEIGFLNDEMDDFAAAPGRPAAATPDSLPQGEANAVAPGKRMLSSMAPTIAWRGDELVALGGRGSLRIPTHVAQVLLDVLVDHDALQAAIDRPRLHHQGLPDRLEAEPGALSPEVERELGRRGHRIVGPGAGETARVNAVRRLADGSFEAAVDARGGSAMHGQGVVAPRR
jgi:gamma-glutamyltranspeptidase/glutathione hydrolase